MWGIIITATGSLFEEISMVIGKTKALAKKETVRTMGFLNLFWMMVIFMLIAVLRPSSFVFSLASLPTFLPRLVLEIFQATYTMKAIIKADRSSFGFIRTGTIPLLLLVDLVLGYSLGFKHVVGISLIVLTIFYLFMNHGIKKKASGIVLFTTINAVATTSLYKYNITNFNSVVAEQLVVLFVLVLYFLIVSWRAKERPIKLMTRPAYFFQSLANGIGGSLVSFAFLFAPASIIMTAKRSSAILWSIVSGNQVFHEKRGAIKLVAFTVVLIGLVLLI